MRCAVADNRAAVKRNASATRVGAVPRPGGSRRGAAAPRSRTWRIWTEREDFVRDIWNAYHEFAPVTIAANDGQPEPEELLPNGHKAERVNQ
jgi:hypothetical protein